MPSAGALTVLKLGGELLDDQERLAPLAADLAAIADQQPLVVVHGGGRQIDSALARERIPRRIVDGLRVTDRSTLDVVVAVLAGGINTRLVAAVNAAGGHGVGLTGADDRLGLVAQSAPHRTADGGLADLGLVGEPIGADPPPLLVDLCTLGYTPIIACIGVGNDGQLFNVNADTLAAHLAVQLRARRLVIAGSTAGVLDEAGQTIPVLDADAADRLIASGTVSAGMIAKLAACRRALRGGVSGVTIVNGRDSDRLRGAFENDHPAGTRVVGAAAVTQAVAGQP